MQETTGDYGDHLISSINSILDDNDSQRISHIPDNDGPNWPQIRPRYIKGHSIVVGHTQYEKWSTIDSDEAETRAPKLKRQQPIPRNSHIKDLARLQAEKVESIFLQQFILRNLHILNANLRNSMILNDRGARILNMDLNKYLLNKNVQQILQNNLNAALILPQWTNYLNAISLLQRFTNQNI